MNRSLIGAVVASAAMMSAPAFATDYPLIVIPGPGTYTANVADSAPGVSTYSDQFLFTLPEDVIASVSLTTTGKNGAANDIDFISATLNGAPLTLTLIPISFGFERDMANIDGVFLLSGVQNILAVTYKAFGTGANFGGTVSAISAVPETGAWALMIAGFGVIGAAFRARRARTVSLKFA